MARYPWSVLGIAKTSDERAIKSAYSSKLKTTRPEDDPAGFQILVEARTAALGIAQRQAAPAKVQPIKAKQRDIEVHFEPDTTAARPIASKTKKDGATRSLKLTSVESTFEPKGEDASNRIAVGAIIQFLCQSGSVKDYDAVKEAVDVLEGGSIAERAQAEWSLIHAIQDWSNPQLDAQMGRGNAQLDDLQRLIIVQLDRSYEWSKNYTHLRQLIGLNAKDLTDTLRTIRHGPEIENIHNNNSMPLWMKIIGILSITYGFALMISLFGRIIWDAYLFLIRP